MSEKTKPNVFLRMFAAAAGAATGSAISPVTGPIPAAAVGAAVTHALNENPEFTKAFVIGVHPPRTQ